MQKEKAALVIRSLNGKKIFLYQKSHTKYIHSPLKIAEQTQKVQRPNIPVNMQATEAKTPLGTWDPTLAA